MQNASNALHSANGVSGTPMKDVAVEVTRAQVKEAFGKNGGEVSDHDVEQVFQYATSRDYGKEGVAAAVADYELQTGMPSANSD